jgi:hypothetical protein
MSDPRSSENLPALVERSGVVEIYSPRQDSFDREPPIEIVIDASQLKERIIDYLGAVLARCWIDRSLIDRIDEDPHRALRHMGILLPDEIDIKVERSNKVRPRLVIYEWNQSRSFRRRICYLQLIMMAGQ